MIYCWINSNSMKLKNFEDLGSIKKTFEIKKPKIVQNDKYKKLTPEQQKHYNDAMVGLKQYSPEEIETFTEKEIKRIKGLAIKTQRVLNLWKQEKVIGYTDYLFEKATMHGKLLEFFTGVKPDNKFNCQLTFRELNITKTDIVLKLMEHGLLPKNFETL